VGRAAVAAQLTREARRRLELCEASERPLPHRLQQKLHPTNALSTARLRKNTNVLGAEVWSLISVLALSQVNKNISWTFLAFSLHRRGIWSAAGRSGKATDHWGIIALQITGA
jgi:hypothetical protein